MGAVTRSIAFVSPLEISLFTEASAGIYRRIRTRVEKRRQTIGSMDLLIASHALSLDVRLVTNNEAEFERVPGLRVENWLRNICSLRQTS